MGMRKKRARIGIQNLQHYAQKKNVRQATEIPEPSTSSADGATPPTPPTFLAAYDSAQKRISDLALHRQEVLAEITQPATVATIARPEHRNYETWTGTVASFGAPSSSRAVATPSSPRPPPSQVESTATSPTATRASDRLKNRHSQHTSEKVLGKRKAAEPEEPCSAEFTPFPQARDELVDQRRRISQFGEGLIHAGTLIREQAWNADETWVSDVLCRANLPVLAAELHAVLSSHSH
ncbi:uncharacterized protein C8Q71DRAFT_474410 [Rhodofomes roseus]|uniref:Uncharacterized protein n=1 Tax=Rhodofomes roseus TaxID=34475 RepID=A0ABQ8KNM9_9APHY|nr:uncharacterized protein C8Q71DRAFT_474410 [Rhodofomes roseus]KAH9840032.1 hypothetical protein C8Q71DRAFT_474410 [Rhodofomes roseus]